MSINRRFFLAGGAAYFLDTLPALAAGKKSLQYIVTDFKTGQTLLAQNPDTQRHPASLTKLMTLYLVMEAMNDPDTSFNLASKVQIPHSIDLIGNGIAVFDNLRAGRKFSARSLLIGAGSRSDAYSTLALALHAGKVYGWKGNENARLQRFIKLMNTRAEELGMDHSNFEVTTGLPYAGHYSTASDIARLIAAMQRHFPQLAELALGQPRFNIREISPATTHTSTLLRANPAIIHFAKTGFTNAAGYCQATYATLKGRDMISVVIGANGRSQRNQVTMDILRRASVVPLKEIAPVTPLPRRADRMPAPEPLPYPASRLKP